MTPETDDSTHYFWSNARDFRRDDQQLHAALDQGFQLAFEHQDKPMIMAQHDAIGGEDFWEMHPVILEGDAGAVRARRILRKLIKEEQAVG
jgi:vanillate O-demethylase monooxygenase subunit